MILSFSTDTKQLNISFTNLLFLASFPLFYIAYNLIVRKTILNNVISLWYLDIKTSLISVYVYIFKSSLQFVPVFYLIYTSN